MPYIPSDAEWYIAELINEITVEGNSANVVHRNFVLINAASPEEAYQKALEFGSSSETSYDNPDGKHVLIRFRGLCDLIVIHDKLEHGVELMYSEEVNVSEDEICGSIRPKFDLTVFREDPQSFKRPDYRSGEVMEQVERLKSNDE